MTTDNTNTPGATGFDVLRWQSAFGVAVSMADTAEKMLVVVTMAEHLRPWLEAEMRRAAE